MAVKWTDEQQKVIDTRGCDLLVSAAAGSGKTAVLVARILKLVTDPDRPVDIDRLLVVTFTNAAAAEMRERVRDALEKQAEEEPDNDHLQRQLVLVHNARITTIHSFCLGVLRNHFQTAGIDPSFRVADEGEILLLEQEAAQETIEAAYENRNADFEAFVEQAAPGKSDGILEELVLQLYHFALGQPWPEDWLEQCEAMYGGPEGDGAAMCGQPECGKTVMHGQTGCDGASAYEYTEKSEESTATGNAESEAGGWDAPANEPWLQYVAEETERRLSDLYEKTLEALRLARDPDGPYPYEKALLSDLELLEQLQGGQDYDAYAEAFGRMGSFARLGTKKDGQISEEKKQQVQSLRGEVKDGLADLRKRFYFDRPEVLRREFADSALAVHMLSRLTASFMERLSEKKAERNLLDFGDLEHLALKVLVRRDGAATAAAREYAELFDEVMIDEYQDSNLVQELILSSVSGRGRAEHNRFMVGDVKQSIYRFRLARPELFMEKYRTYREMREACRIDLHRNFRSRSQVLESINFIFRQIMTENPGQIVYDEDAELRPGAVFAPFQEDAGAQAENAGLRTELHLLENSGGDKIRQEAELAAHRIKALVGHMRVWDKEEEGYRPARYRDIVILLRTVSGWADTFAEVFTDLGIPCFTGSQKGYFSATEVRVVLSYLQILDNPIQDIPLAAVLRSAIGQFSDDELARIRSFSEHRYFYDCCQAYRKCGEDSQLRQKLETFFDLFEELRSRCGHTPVHLLLWEILDRTGYGEYAAALPAGRQRRANLDMLVEKAIAYEATSYRGLYHFVRYIENLKKYEVDYGEANIGSEADDTVRIMSIHKSKGLEFPIVFVCGMGKKFNESDSRSRVALHPDFGIGCDWVDTEERTRRPTLLKRVIQQKIISENLGEELRILYVAMTRAKEKLILTGGIADLEKSLDAWARAAGGGAQTLSYSALAGASTCLDWVVPALLRHPAGRRLLEKQAPEEPVFEEKTLLTDAASGMIGNRSEEMPVEPDRLEPAAVMPVEPDRLEPAAVMSAESDPSELTAVEENGNSGAGYPAEFDIFTTDVCSEEVETEADESRETVRLSQLLQVDPEVCQDAQTHAYLEHVFQSVYPYESNRSIVGKLSVSELKRMSHVTEEDPGQELYAEETVIPLLPSFRSEQKSIEGAARGTLYHLFMENLDFSKKDQLEIQLEELISCGKMTREESEVLELQDIRRFLESGIGSRMAAAAGRGQLYRERPFVLGVSASEIRPGWSPEETVLVQGIIDAYFEEPEGIVLLDYKTDRVFAMETLAERYRAQLDYYAMALKRLTGSEVICRAIYSFHLGRELLI